MAQGNSQQLVQVQVNVEKYISNYIGGLSADQQKQIAHDLDMDGTSNSEISANIAKWFQNICGSKAGACDGSDGIRQSLILQMFQAKLSHDSSALHNNSNYEKAKVLSDAMTVVRKQSSDPNTNQNYFAQSAIDLNAWQGQVIQAWQTATM